MKKSRYQLRHLFIPYDAKIADINESDTNEHSLNLATALSETRTIVAVFLSWSRLAGTGLLGVYSKTSAARYSGYISTSEETTTVVLDDSPNLYYKQSVANDDFDVFCTGYVVEVP